MRFCLVDRILSLEAGESVTATKSLSLAEEYLGDHFPGFPVMPGVLMVESLVQSGAWLMRHSEQFQYSTILLKEARAVRFNNFVSPGQTLEIECTVHKKTDRTYTLKGRGTVDGESAVSARLTLEQFNLSDSDPKLASSDEMRIAKMKQTFETLWRPDSN